MCGGVCGQGYGLGGLALNVSNLSLEGPISMVKE